MTIKERVALLVAGYSKKEIELMEKAETAEPAKDESTPVTTAEPAKDESTPVTDTSNEADTSNEPDYKALYEESEKNRKATEEKLKKAQSMNNKKDIGGKIEEPDEYLKKLFAEFM